MLARNNPLVRALTTRTFRQSPLSKNLKGRDSKAHGEAGHAEHAEHGDHGDHGHHGYPYPASHIPFAAYEPTGYSRVRNIKLALQLAVPVTVFAALPVIGFLFQQSKLG